MVCIHGIKESEIADKVSSFFPNNSTGVLGRAIRQYKGQQTWPKNALIGEDGYTAMRDILIEGSLVDGRYPYQRLVRPEFARNALSK